MRTQKSKGLVELRNKVKEWPVPPFVVLSIPPLPGFPITFPIFARPCPVTPRHGFVESRLVDSLDQLMVVWKETIEADLHGEVVLMRPVVAKLSAVWAGGNLAMGPGNAGATEGKDSFTFPTTDKPPIIEKWETIKDSPFFEFVNNGKITYIVQLRDGPNPGRGQDQIPYDLVVTRIILATGDFKYWEDLMLEVGKEERGAVVYHEGGNLTSHYAIHAKLNKVPLMCSRKPKLGESLSSTYTPRPANIEEFQKGIYYGLTTPSKYWKSDSILPNMGKAGEFVLTALHNSAYFDLSIPEHARWMGAACALAVRVSWMSCLGEIRYCKSKPTLGISGKGRHKIYEEGWNDFEEMLERIVPALHLFADQKKWTGGFGGKKWRLCCEASILLWNECVKVLNGEDPKDLVLSLNRTINQYHNGGWFWSKFMDCGLMTDVPKRASYYALKNLRLIYTIGKESLLKVPNIKINPVPVDIPPPPPSSFQVQVRCVSCPPKGSFYVLRFQVKDAEGGYSEIDQKASKEMYSLIQKAEATEKSLAGTNAMYVALKKTKKDDYETFSVGDTLVLTASKNGAITFQEKGETDE